MRFFPIMLGLFIIMPLSAAWAQDCANASDQASLNMCADMAYKKTDIILNAVYSQIVARLKGDPQTTKLLVTAQKSWLSFRDAECNFATSGSAEGSVYPMLVTQCRDDLTSKRIEDLKLYLHCQEGDLSCPVPPS